MKKIITPFLYFCGIIPVFYVVFLPTILIYGAMEFFIDVDGLEFAMGGIFLISGGSFVLWNINRAMELIESKNRIGIFDHFRQSIFYYVFFCFGLRCLFPFQGGLAQGYLALMIVVSAHAIIVNLIYLLNKKNKHIALMENNSL